MNSLDSTQVRTFIAASEVWKVEGDRLVHACGNYGKFDEFESASVTESFGLGEGLPGKSWAEARPIVMKSFDATTFKRTDVAASAGLTSAVAIPVFSGENLKAVLVVLCSDSQERIGAIEVWEERDGLLMLNDGYYGAAQEFEFVSQHTHFPHGQGLPGGVWAARAPMLMRDLGSGYKFVRADSAGKAGLTTGLGIPVPAPDRTTFVLTLLSALGTPIARRFEIWKARGGEEAEIIDGLCERDGPLWSNENARRISIWKGPLGRVLGSGMPVVETEGPGTAGFSSLVALPIYSGDSISHIIAWYC